MFKIFAIVCLTLVGTLWGVSSSCDSCGSDCAPACGTRHFRTCCFNYLRKKRGVDADKFWNQDMQEGLHKQPVFVLKTLPEAWFTAEEHQPNHLEDTIENPVQFVNEI